MTRVLAVLEELRRWIWIVALVAGVAGIYHIFVIAPRQAQAVTQQAGEAEARIEEVNAAAARGDDADVQRRHAEALDRAEHLLGSKP